MNLVTGMKIKFTESVFIGSWKKPKFSHERTIVGTITTDSYGEKTGQHTFTILVENCADYGIFEGDKIRRKGRNVYPKCKVLANPIDIKTIEREKGVRRDKKNEAKRGRIEASIQ